MSSSTASSTSIPEGNVAPIFNPDTIRKTKPIRKARQNLPVAPSAPLVEVIIQNDSPSKQLMMHPPVLQSKKCPVKARNANSKSLNKNYKFTFKSEETVVSVSKPEETAASVFKIKETVVPVFNIKETVPVFNTKEAVLPVSNPEKFVVPVFNTKKAVVPVFTKETALPVSNPAKAAVPVSNTEKVAVPVFNTKETVIPPSNPEKTVVPVSNPEKTVATPSNQPEQSTIRKIKPIWKARKNLPVAPTALPMEIITQKEPTPTPARDSNKYPENTNTEPLYLNRNFVFTLDMLAANSTIKVDMNQKDPKAQAIIDISDERSTININDKTYTGGEASGTHISKKTFKLHPSAEMKVIKKGGIKIDDLMEIKGDDEENEEENEEDDEENEGDDEENEDGEENEEEDDEENEDDDEENEEDDEENDEENDEEENQEDGEESEEDDEENEEDDEEVESEENEEDDDEEDEDEDEGNDDDSYCGSEEGSNDENEKESDDENSHDEVEDEKDENAPDYAVTAPQTILSTRKILTPYVRKAKITPTSNNLLQSQPQSQPQTQPQPQPQPQQQTQQVALTQQSSPAVSNFSSTHPTPEYINAKNTLRKAIQNAIIFISSLNEGPFTEQSLIEFMGKNDIGPAFIAGISLPQIREDVRSEMKAYEEYVKKQLPTAIPIKVVKGEEEDDCMDVVNDEDMEDVRENEEIPEEEPPTFTQTEEVKAEEDYMDDVNDENMQDLGENEENESPALTPVGGVQEEKTDFVNDVHDEDMEDTKADEEHPKNESPTSTLQETAEKTDCIYDDTNDENMKDIPAGHVVADQIPDIITSNGGPVLETTSLVVCSQIEPLGSTDDADSVANTVTSAQPNTPISPEVVSMADYSEQKSEPDTISLPPSTTNDIDSQIVEIMRGELYISTNQTYVTEFEIITDLMKGMSFTIGLGEDTGLGTKSTLPVNQAKQDVPANNSSASVPPTETEPAGEDVINDEDKSKGPSAEQTTPPPDISIHTKIEESPESSTIGGDDGATTGVAHEAVYEREGRGGTSGGGDKIEGGDKKLDGGEEENKEVEEEEEEEEEEKTELEKEEKEKKEKEDEEKMAEILEAIEAAQQRSRNWPSLCKLDGGKGSAARKPAEEKGVPSRGVKPTIPTTTTIITTITTTSTPLQQLPMWLLWPLVVVPFCASFLANTGKEIFRRAANGRSPAEISLLVAFYSMMGIMAVSIGRLEVSWVGVVNLLVWFLAIGIASSERLRTKALHRARVEAEEGRAGVVSGEFGGEEGGAIKMVTTEVGVWEGYHFVVPNQAPVVVPVPAVGGLCSRYELGVGASHMVLAIPNDADAKEGGSGGVGASFGLVFLGLFVWGGARRGQLRRGGF